LTTAYFLQKQAPKQNNVLRTQGGIFSGLSGVCLGKNASFSSGFEAFVEEV